MTIDYEARHRARVERLRSARGWLSLTDKIVLHPGPNRIDGLGTITLAGRVVHLDAEPGVRANGEPVTTKDLRTDASKDHDRLEHDGRLYEIMERGDAFAVRVRDLRELPRPFAGIDRYPVDPTWRKTARLVPHATPTRIPIDFEGPGDVHEEMESAGVLAFEHEGTTLELEALTESATRLFVVFRDATSGGETYATGRFLYASLPDASGEVVLDFNDAMLPGCAFTIHATCPIPPAKDRLPIAIRAGEKSYLGEPVGAGAAAG